MRILYACTQPAISKVGRFPYEDCGPFLFCKVSPVTTQVMGLFYFQLSVRCTMYLEKEVLPIFKAWVDSMTAPVPMKDARKYGQYFIANHIDPVKAMTRGNIYDLFEKVADGAEVQAYMYAGKLPDSEMVKITNMETLAKGVTWAIQHDGFDSVKYDTITGYGSDIHMQHGAKAPVM